ncbi:M28 family metallopeptidase [Polluticaenibacter yanchengensis]|uniref:M28 family metallopeptidase n=1 Tax=Polluticaenibacter yanchengensis TaxID=3014562 RepID=A0ABT4UL82_9BACT|nr:M28 family metallopeptidase [Chitinophagaceae bacterium LY-5]
MTHFKKHFIHLLAMVVLAGCTEQNPQNRSLDNLLEAIDGKGFSEYMSVLASDSLEGRKPFTNGEIKTIDYLKNEFGKLGLAPGNGKSYLQEVPLVDIKSQPAGNLVFKGKAGSVSLNYLEDFVATSKRAVAQTALEASDMVFAGFGIVAPEYNWNDYKDIDVRGKTVLVLVNDPGFYDSSLFRGNNMTYYGRWTYKFEEAARQGAAGVLIIHDTKPASYGWTVIRSSWSKSKLSLQTADNNMSKPAVEGWISQASTEKLLALAGLDKSIFHDALKPGFKAFPINTTASVTLNNTIKKSVSNNVVAMIPGSKRPDEYIIYTAHWDHFGIGEKINGDSIYNGAVDNASGTAALLELAKAFMKSKPERSVVFLAVTAEEQGLLGSEYYATNPIYPLSKTVADINMDVLQPFGRMKDIIVVGKGQSELDEYIENAAKKQNRITRGEPDPSGGWYFRSDHFNFAKVGIPSLYIGNGTISVDKGEEWGNAQKKAYNDKLYHSPKDEYAANWDISGIIEDIRLLFDVGYTLSNETSFPKWKEGSEFKMKRKE